MRIKTYLTFASFFTLIVAEIGLGQRAKISGYVYENDVRKANIKIMVVGAHETITDIDGHFRIILPNDHFIPGQPIIIRVNNWKVFDPIFGQSTAQDTSFKSASITVSIIRPGSTLAHQDRKRLGVIVAAFQRENRTLSKTVLSLQNRLTLQTGSIETLTEEAARLREENQKYDFLRKYTEEYEIPLDAIKSALDDWARNKKADDDLEAARQAYWRGDFAQVIEFTNRAEPTKDELARKNRQEGLKLNRERLDMYKLKLSALVAQTDIRGLYDAAKKLENLFEIREISKDDFPKEWAENKLEVAATAFFKQALIDLEKPTLASSGKSELIAESLRAFQSVENYYSPERFPGDWASMKIIWALVSQYQNIVEARDAKYLNEIIESINEVLSARDANGKIITSERFPTEWWLAQYMLGSMSNTLSSKTTGPESLKHLRDVIKTQRDVLAASNAGVKVFTPEKFPQEWARAQSLLASALLDLSRRTQGPDSLAHLREAIVAYKALFAANNRPAFSTSFGSYFYDARIYTPEKFPQEWAKSQSSLGSALFELSRRITGKDSVTALSEAVAAYRAALEASKLDAGSRKVKLSSPEESFQEWAMRQGWLGISLLELSRRTVGPDSLTYLKDAIAANQAILEASDNGKKIFTPERFPREWVMAQQGLGNCLIDLSVKTPEADGLTHARSAITAYKAILAAESSGIKTFVPEKFPVEWIGAQRGLGIASAEANRRLGEPTELSYLTDTIAAYKAVLSASVGGKKLFTPEAFPDEWVFTQSALGAALTELSSKTQGPDSLKYQNEAIATYKDLFAASRAGVKFFTPEAFPQQWALDQNNLSVALIVRSRLTPDNNDLQDLNDAIAASRMVLEANNQGTKIYTPETFPTGWVRAQINLGSALADLSYRTSPADKINRANAAIEAAKAALSANKAGARIVTPEAFPNDWLLAQYVLANGYSSLDAWAQARDVFVEILQRFPDNKIIYQRLSIVYSEKLFMFDQAFDLHQQWLIRHPKDVEAQTGFATAHFKTGRFPECARRIDTLLGIPDLPSNFTIGLRAIEIANLIALNRQNEVLGKLDALIKEVSAQPALFRLAWSFDGAKNYIDQLENMKPQRVWLHQLFDAFQSKDRDALLVALRKTQASWKISITESDDRPRLVQLFYAIDVPIKRHIKVRGAAIRMTCNGKPTSSVERTRR